MTQFYKIYKKYLKAAFSFALLVGSSATVIAQVSAYSFAQNIGIYTPITGTLLEAATANTSTGNLNSNVYPVALPFNFIFNGTSYSSLNVSTNGFITFGTTAPSATNVSPLSTAAAYDGAISVFGRDLSSVFDINGVTGDISWTTTGSAPNREVVIQWKDFRPNSSTSVTTAYTFAFQVRLKETSNVIQMVYNSGSYLVGSTNVTGTAQIGLRGATVADFNNRLNATTLEFINSTAGTASNSSQAFNVNNSVPGMPAAGLTYTWTPPTCYIPSGLAAGSSTSNTAAISWTASPSSPASYDIYYSTSNTPPTSTTPPMNTNVPGTSTTLSSLSPATVYYVWIRSNCGNGNTSIWTLQPIRVLTLCVPPAIAVTGATVCPNNTATLSATTDPGASITWYDAAVGGNMVGTGSTFTTPVLTNTTSYYVTSATGGTFTGGFPDAISASGYTLDAGLLFDVYSTMTIKGVYVYPMGTGNGTVEIALQDGNVSPAVTLQTITVNLTGSGSPYVKTYVPLNFAVGPGNNYKLMMLTRSGDVSGLLRESGSSWGSYPLTVSGIFSITGGNLTANSPSTSYYYFYDWEVSNKCESERTAVTATINCLGTSEVEAKDLMKVYPNPFKETIIISDIEKARSLQVLDVSGRIIKTIDNLSKEIHLGDLKSGLYILNLHMKDGTQKQTKVIKQ
ncbi:Ig-like domain-containing protein [Chryseobacterium contaminans]|uniref:Por secretion system C-terminal sorting domain-containing protein n=1 Tax=Chryseobacterium contaminans TaxID=1423959 RepID=A0A1M7HHB7_9FLAO|nr:T9SS type A sorting domain-containing protein [Chryseobacterium contaminans]SHM27854.1 Por secretion system C-terminal sorting domain-containing protein [Chryseobacterium contaminans]